MADLPIQAPRGVFITLEGPEGGGKTTQIDRLTSRIQQTGRSVVRTREPGGTEIGERIRVLLLELDAEIASRAEALLFCAARAQLVAEVIEPALAGGHVVVCDRFYDATLAYQGYGRGLPLPELASVIGFATGGLAPDLTLLLDVPVGLGLERRRADGAGMNRLDATEKAFHQAVRDGYHKLAGADPGRWRVIDATPEAAVVAEAVWATVGQFLGSMNWTASPR